MNLENLKSQVFFFYIIIEYLYLIVDWQLLICELYIPRSREIMSSVYRPLEDLFDKELLENCSSEMEEDFITGSLSHSPHIPILGSSPFFGCMSG